MILFSRMIFGLNKEWIECFLDNFELSLRLYLRRTGVNEQITKLSSTKNALINFPQFSTPIQTRPCSLKTLFNAPADLLTEYIYHITCASKEKETFSFGLIIIVPRGNGRSVASITFKVKNINFNSKVSNQNSRNKSTSGKLI